MSTASDFERCVAGGGVAVFPADTVYGLACDPGNADAVERLYALKGEIVSRGVRSVLGIEMPVFPKRRFQHGSVAAADVARLFPESETRYRRHFELLHSNPTASTAHAALV